MPPASALAGVVFAIAVALGGSAAADDARGSGRSMQFEALGSAPAEAEQARVQALDAAFLEVVEQALVRLLDVSTRARHEADLEARIQRRARRYIRSYRVLEETRRGSRMQVRISAQVDEARLRAALDELGIEAGATPAGGGTGRRAVVLVQVSQGGRVEASFGADGGDGGPVGRALAELAREYGFGVVGAEGASAPGSGSPGEGLPLDDEAAARVAGAVGADVVFVAGVELGVPGRIRGTALAGVVGRGALRVLEVSDGEARLVADAHTAGGGFASTEAEASEEAARALVRRLGAAVAGAVAEYWPPRAPAEDALLVEIRGHQDWQPVAAIVEHLGRSSGISRVWPRWVGVGGTILAVVTDVEGARARRRVAAALRRLDLRGTGPEGAGALEMDIDDDGEGLRVTVHAGEDEAP